jgi:UDP:flavonoid glycosyltransferase YjiC (YdhE family)
VVIVLFPDQGLTAERLAATGAGISLEVDHLDVNDIEKAVSMSLSDDAPRRAARRLGAEILAQPAPAEIVGELETVGDEISLVA